MCYMARHYLRAVKKRYTIGIEKQKKALDVFIWTYKRKFATRLKLDQRLRKE